MQNHLEPNSALNLTVFESGARMAFMASIPGHENIKNANFISVEAKRIKMPLWAT